MLSKSKKKKRLRKERASLRLGGAFVALATQPPLPEKLPRQKVAQKLQRHSADGGRSVEKIISPNPEQKTGPMRVIIKARQHQERLNLIGRIRDIAGWQKKGGGGGRTTQEAYNTNAGYTEGVDSTHKIMSSQENGWLV